MKIGPFSRGGRSRGRKSVTAADHDMGYDALLVPFAEHEYDGGYTIVKDAVRAWRHGQAEVFVPLSHRPGTAQADFGEVTVILNGVKTKVAFFVITLPYSDTI
ncbi:MAG: hypothetical protein CMJ50_03220, partial [Planctomycetaceae bacterium]|nr:hypothetical protein [Planctomycetaceae bacterium]